jgi:hypothetical protein
MVWATLKIPYAESAIAIEPRGIRWAILRASFASDVLCSPYIAPISGGSAQLLCSS